MIDRESGTVLADGSADHTEAVLKSLMGLLTPLGIEQFYTQGGDGYARLLKEDLSGNS